MDSFRLKAGELDFATRREVGKTVAVRAKEFIAGIQAMQTDVLFWFSLLLPLLTGGALLRIVWRDRQRPKQRDPLSRMGRFLLAALFIWSSIIVFVQQLWYLNEDSILGLFLLLPLISGGLVWLFARWHRARRIHAGVGALLIGNALVLFWLLTFLPLLLEVYARFIYDQTDSLARTKVSQRWLQRHFQLNAAGFPDTVEYVQRIEPGKRRVTLVGDSFAAGYGVKRIEDRLVGSLRAAYPEWEIHLLAFPGADTGLQIQFVTDYFNDGFQTDEVVLVYCLNDVTDLPGSWNEVVQIGEAKSVKEWRWRWLPENSYFADALYHRLRVVRNPNLRIENYGNYIFAGYKDDLWEQQKQRLAALRDLVQSNGARLSAVTFPFVHAVGPGYQFQFVHDQLDDLWHELEVRHLDLLPAFDGIPSEKLTANRFDAHPSSLAHGLAADEIGEFLEKQSSNLGASETEDGKVKQGTDEPAVSERLGQQEAGVQVND